MCNQEKWQKKRRLTGFKEEEDMHECAYRLDSNSGLLRLAFEVGPTKSNKVIIIFLRCLQAECEANFNLRILFFTLNPLKMNFVFIANKMTTYGTLIYTQANSMTALRLKLMSVSSPFAFRVLLDLYINVVL